MSSYSNYFSIAKHHNITEFTPLQDKAFRSKEVTESKQNVFVIGETSSGKTLIPMLLYEEAVIEAQKLNTDFPKMLFVVPYRALAAQKHMEFRQFWEKYNLDIIQSTGEFRQHDYDIQSGNVDVAVIIAEKVFKFQARDENFLERYDFIVLDEIGLVDSSDRGIYYDFLFAWGANAGRRFEKLRMIALGTPFYNWDIYIQFYDFYPITTNKGRPVNLKYNTIFFRKQGISQVDGDNDFLYRSVILTAAKFEKLQNVYENPYIKCSDLDFPCSINVDCRRNPSLLCEKLNNPCTSPILILQENMGVYRYILLQICRYHLLRGEQMILFLNNREEVITISLFLYYALSQMPELAGIFPPPPPVEMCRRKILEECGLKEDDVYGILEFEDGTEIKRECYQAFVSGVAFHSAALPNELRTYVERKMLASREMKIVCSTETLAFGINSAVDVVVIANLMKRESNVARMISKNEFCNYAGRAGRLRIGIRAEQIQGTVYTLVKNAQKEAWNKILEEKIPSLKSVFYSNADEKMPFFLLNLIPENTKAGINLKQILEIVLKMPRDIDKIDEGLETTIKDTLNFLVKQGLLEKRDNHVSRGRSHGNKVTESVYYLTALGRRLKGYILDKGDYEMLKDSVDIYVKSVYSEPDRVTYIYRLLCTKHASSALNNVYEDSNTKLSFETVCGYIRAKAQDYDMDWPPDWLKESNKKNIFVLAAILAWCDGESSKSIFKKYGMHYALLNRLSEQIAYLIEIAKELIPDCMELQKRKLMESLEKLVRNGKCLPKDIIREEDFLKQCDDKLIGAERLSIALYYGINTRIHKQVMDYLEQQGKVSTELIARYELKSLSPKTAREFRKIVLAYTFFEKPMPEIWEDSEEKSDYMSLRRQQYLEMKEIHPLIFRYFKEKFKDSFTDLIN